MVWLLIAGLVEVSSLQAQGNELLRDAFSREVSVSIGAEDPGGGREITTREMSVFVGQEGTTPWAQVNSREWSLLIKTSDFPEAITNLIVEISPTGESVRLDWSRYNELLQHDVVRYDIFLSTTPFTDVTEMSRVASVPAGTFSWTTNGLAAGTDHYFAVVPVDADGFNPVVTYAAWYVLGAEAISRELSFFVGGEPEPPFAQTTSREWSLVVTTPEPPARVTNVVVTSSSTGEGVTLDWSAYNELLQVVDRYDIYYAAVPFTSVTGLNRIASVRAGTLTFRTNGLPAFQDHYFVVVAVDAFGRFDDEVEYSAAYTLGTEAHSREVSLFVGSEPGDLGGGYAQALSRELTILVPDDSDPAPVTGVDSGFDAVTSRSAFSAIDAFWPNYNELAQQDVARYRIYIESSVFTDVSELQPYTNAPAGVSRWTIRGLFGGNIYFVAAVAEDVLGNFNKTVYSRSAKASPSQLGDIRNLAVVSSSDSLRFTWLPPEGGEEVAAFLAGYRLYFSGAATPVTLPAGTTTWSAEDLDSASGYTLRVHSVDIFGVESGGAQLTTATWLPQPGDVTGESFDRAARLTWKHAEPNELVEHYALYQSPTAFSDVTSMTPVQTTRETRADLGGLNNGVPYFFAVTTVNISGGENPAVQSIAVTPNPVPGNFADLAITNIVSPASAYRGQPITVTWSVTNAGAGPTTTRAGAPVTAWTDRLVLSPDRVFGNTNDVTLASALHPGTLEAGAGYTASASVQVPTNLFGLYYVFVLADADGAVYEHLDSAANLGMAALALQVTAAPPPVVLTQPQSRTVEAGRTVSLVVAASGTGTLGYQWYLAGNPVGGATASTLTLSRVRLDQAGDYHVVVTDAYGSTQSATATLTVTPDTTAPLVTEFIPLGPIATSVTNVQFRFSEAIQPESLTRDDVRVTTPSGPLDSDQIEIQQVNDLLFRAVFPEQTADGNYRVQIGPEISDLAGNFMAAGYEGSFTLDHTRPVLSNLSLAGAPLAPGSIVRNSGILSLDAEDGPEGSGVQRVEFYSDDRPIGTDSNPADGFSVLWDLDLTPEGPHTVEARAFDALGNAASLAVPVTVAMAPPPAPVIVSPADGTRTNGPLMVLRGTTARNTTVVFYRNGAEVGARVPVTVSGIFEAPVPLLEGTNQIQVSAINRGGEGLKSPPLRLILDRSAPAAPVALQAWPRDGGRVLLDWADLQPELVRGYHVYRATTRFTEPSQAQRITPKAIAELSFADFPPGDGAYFYAVSTVNAAGTEGPLSALAETVSDATPPVALTVEYFPEGRFDPATGVYGTGPIRVEVTMSEPLLAPPFFSLTPSNGIPILVELTSVNSGAANQYSGRFIVSFETPSGPALPLLSARDRVGNRGSTIASGATVLEFDTAGPQIVGLEVAPGRVVRNDPAAPVTVVWTAHLDEAVRAGTTPEFRYSLSRSQPNETPVAAIEPGSDPLTWIVRVALPATAGTEPEDLVLEFRAEDALQNVGTRILPEHRFQVYQGDLPQLVPPGNLLAQSMAGGAIRLTWLPVAEAVDYDVFRKKLEEANFTLLQRVGLINQLTNLPAEDGGYHYVVAAVRRENGQESVGEWSSVAQAISDRVPPGPPGQLTLELASNGVFARWEPPQGVNESITYGLVRAATGPIDAVDGIKPYREKIPATQVVDPSPNPAEAFYAVYAEDSVGNRSQPSNTEYLNAQLLPVQNLTVVQQDDSAPVLTWTQPSPSATGYDVYLGPDENSLKLNPAGPLTSRTFTDAGYSGDDRLYTIFTLDDTGHQSLGRSLVLPDVRWELAADAVIRRGLMNRVHVDVYSLSEYPLDNARLALIVAGHTNFSEPFSLEPGASGTAGIVVGGYSDLEISDPANGTAPIRIVLENQPHEGESAILSRPATISVGDGQLVVGVLPRDFTRGGSGTVQFSLRNPGAVEVEVLTSRRGGDSSDIRFNLLDTEGNLLSTAPFKAVLGAHIINLPNGDAVLRLGPGAEALSPAFTLAVPTNAPNRVFVQVEMDHVYYRHGQPEEVGMQGLQTRSEVPVVDTTYTGLVTSVAPADSAGDEPIQIRGSAILRSTGGPAPNVPLLVKIANAGFERTDTVTTDASGAFLTTFEPLPGEPGGIYSVWAVHPDLRDRTVQQTFTLRRVVVTPSEFAVRAPFNFSQPLALVAGAGPGTTVTNLRVVARPEDQPNGILPRGVTVDSGAGITLEAEGTATLAPAITADDTAAAKSELVLAVVSDDRVNPWQKLTAKLEFSQATPVLHWNPSFVQTGVAPGSNVLAQITLENIGLADARDLKFSLVSANGAPAPAWATLGTLPTLAALPVGGQLEIGLNFQPGTNVAEADHQFKLLITATNHPSSEVSAYVSVNASGRGDALIWVVDMNTAKDSSGNLTGGLAGASVHLQQEPSGTNFLSQFETNLVTNAEGEAHFQNLPAGRYQYRITADQHHGVNGRLWVRPGTTATEQIALAYSLVSVDWEVVPIVIEDRYEIVLQAVFQTEVPAPVVVIEPAVVNLPQLFAGDVFYGEFSIQNHGLIDADDFQFSLPASDGYLEYELLAGLPDHLDAKQRLRVPYRITCKQSFPGPNSESASGRSGAGARSSSIRPMGSSALVVQALGAGQISSGFQGRQIGLSGGSGSSGCYRYAAGAQARYRYKCANDLVFTGGASAGWHYNYSRGCPGGGPGGGGYWFGGWGGGGGGGSSGGGPGGTPLLSDICVPTMECGPSGKCDNQCCSGQSGAGSWVDLVSREYRDEVTDLKVKIPGGEASVVRHFFRNTWHWADLARSLEFTQGADGLLKIRRFLIDYRPINTARTVFAYREIRISREAEGWRWENKDGDWEFYSLDGRLLNTGHRHLDLTRFDYDSDGRLESVADREGRTLFTYLYAGDQLSGVRDLSGREVRYGFTSGRLTSFRDAVTNEMTFIYDGDGRLISKRDINGLERHIAYQTGSQVSSVLDQHGNGKFYQFFYDKNNRTYYSLVHSTGGETEEKWFNAQGRLVDQVRSGVQGDKVQFDGRNEIITKNTGVVWFRDYDEWGNLTREVRPDGGVVQTDYHPVFHLPVREVNPRGAITLWQYDDQGNLLERIEAAGTEIARTNRWEYDEASRLIRQVDGRGNRMEYAYDEADNLVREFDPENPAYQTFYGYDARGNRTALTNALGYVIFYGYDGLDRLIAETNTLQHVTLYTYQGKNLVEVETGREGENRGHVVRYRYDDHGRRTQTLRVDEQDQEHVWETTTYDADGQVIAVANALGQTTRFEYNAAGQRVKVVQPFSATETSDTQYVYDDFGRLTQEIDPLGVITKHEYDELNRERKVTEALGTSVQRSRERGYDLAGNLKSITYSDGTNALTTLYTYDLLDRRTQIRGAREYPKDFEYDANDNLTAEINGRGYRTEHAYDPYNRRTNTVEGIGNGEPGEHAGSFEYDLIGNVVTAYDGNRNHRHYHHDILGRPTEESIPLGPTNAVPAGNWWLDDSVVLNRTWHNPWGQPVASSNIVGAVTATVYDVFGRRFTHTDAAGLTLTNAYNALDQPVAIGYPVVSSAPSGSPPTSIRYAYDSYNAQMLVSVTDRANLTTTYGYNRRLQRASELSSWGALTTYRYNELGRQTAVTNALEEVTQSVFDQFDQLVATIHADHIPVTQERIEYRAYDEYGRMTNHWGAATYDVAYTYDLTGNQVSLTDGNGNTTRWEYDGRNRKVRKMYADNSDYEYGYDANGNQIRKRDAMQRTTGYEFNPYDLLVRTDYPNDPDVTFSYDPGGRRVLMVDGTGTNTWSYDAAGRVLENAQFNVEHAVNYTYDAEGKRLSMTIVPLSVGDARISNYTYDTAARLVTIVDHGVSDFSFRYTWATNANRLTNLDYLSGIQTSYAYDLLGRKTLLSTFEASQVEIARFAYSHDRAGQRATETTLTHIDQFAYDAKRQLVAARRFLSDSTPDPNWDFAYEYDLIGNRKTAASPGAVHQYTANTVNQYSAITNAIGQTPKYDKNGNLFDDGETVYRFDDDDHLIESSNSITRLAFQYDGIGRRVLEEHFESTATTARHIVYDGRLALGGSSDDEVQSYWVTRGLDLGLSRDQLGGIGGLLHIQGTSRSVVLNDVSGSVRGYWDVVDNTNTAIDYDPFGQIVSSGASLNREAYMSKENFKEYGFIDFGRRVLSPSLGRWLTRDPLGERGGESIYGFVKNDPVNHVDAFGECEVLIFGQGRSVGGGEFNPEDPLRPIQGETFPPNIPKRYDIGEPCNCSNTLVKWKASRCVAIVNYWWNTDWHGKDNLGNSGAQHEHHHADIWKEYVNQYEKIADSYLLGKCYGIEQATCLKSENIDFLIWNVQESMAQIKNRIFDRDAYGGGGDLGTVRIQLLLDLARLMQAEAHCSRYKTKCKY